jgi:kinesin family protein 11
MAPSEKSKPVNVKVIVRARPPNSDELASRAAGAEILTASPSSREVTVVAPAQGGKTQTKKFTFDEVHGPSSTQAEVFDASIASIVDEVLQGFNCTVFAYGPTGTGKTFTMEGGRSTGEGWASDADTDGVIPRAVRRIFESLNNNDNEYNVRVSFLELYNEELSDLIAPGDVLDGTSSSISGKKLKIFEDPSGRRGQIVQGLEETCVTSVPDVMALLEKSSQRRRVAETLMNKHSSRSHSIFTIVIHIKETTSDGEELLKIGKLNLVDLAGSECIGRSGALHQRAKEAGMINQSLLTLGRVITALVDHTPHVPYRESKLTRLLQDSLGGRTKTCVIATVSPCAGSLEETLSTLDYAYRARNIRNKVGGGGLFFSFFSYARAVIYIGRGAAY